MRGAPPPPPRSPPPDHAQPTRQPPRALVVDDNRVYRSTLHAILGHGAYAVTEAESLAEARAALAAPPFDLVILDIELGDGNGLDLISEVRAAMATAAVVVMSGGDAVTSIDGADLVLVKTLDPASLLTKLDQVVAKR